MSTPSPTLLEQRLMRLEQLAIMDRPLPYICDSCLDKVVAGVLLEDCEKCEVLFRSFITEKGYV